MRLSRVTTLLAFTVALLWSVVAQAADLGVAFSETTDGVIIHVRSDEALAEPVRIGSKSSMLLRFPGQRVVRQRHKIPGKQRRLSSITTAQTGDDAAVRLVQRQGTPGAFGSFVKLKPVANGYDIAVVDADSATLAARAAARTEHAASALAATLDRAPTRGSVAAMTGDMDTAAKPDAEPESEPSGDAEASPGSAKTPDGDGALRGASDPVSEEAPAAASAAETDREPGPAGGVTEENFPWQAPTNSGAGMASLLPLALSAAFALGAWIVVQRRRQTQAVSRGRMVIHDRVGIGPKQAILQVNVGDRSFLVGATEANITLLATLDEPAPTASRAAPTSSLTVAPVGPAATQSSAAPPEAPTLPAASQTGLAAPEPFPMSGDAAPLDSAARAPHPAPELGVTKVPAPRPSPSAGDSKSALRAFRAKLDEALRREAHQDPATLAPTPAHDPAWVMGRHHDEVA